VSDKFNLEDYSSAADRIDQWHKDYPENRIYTEYILNNFGNEARPLWAVMFRAWIFKNATDTAAFSTGSALNWLSESFAFEKCETSSIARALANANYAAKLGTPRASREEMEAVNALPKVSVIPHGASNPQEEKQSTHASWQTDLPAGVGWAVESEELVRGCTHGDMTFRSGFAKGSGKEWRGYFCPVDDKAQQCAPIWLAYENGEWS